MILETIPELAKLTAEEKLILASELWDEVAANPSDIPVPLEHLAELDRRMEAYRKSPERVTTWEAIQKRILA